MLSQKSLRTKFALQLAGASAMLILIFSVMLYHYIKITIFENVIQSLKIEADNLEILPTLDDDFLIELNSQKSVNSTIVSISDSYKHDEKPYFLKTKKDKKSFLTLHYPSKKFSKTILLQKETTEYTSIINQILVDIIIINATAIFLVIFYALFLSRMLLLPIKTISEKLSHQNEKFLQGIDESEVCDEFLPLAKSINHLIKRIESFMCYQKELFIGIAHELKTPLAVMKTKNEVTLIKEREPFRYIEALKNSNESIDNMNKMIGSILEIGRQESAQFEKHEEKEMISHLKILVKNFKILAHQSDISVVCDLSPQTLTMMIQPTLLTHVLQNFIQNAIKFSQPKSQIKVSTYILEDKFYIQVSDEGVGIDESKDLFAPFKRYGGKQGAGLGLFLAKGACEAMGGEIEIKNRQGGKGTIATLKLPIIKS